MFCSISLTILYIFSLFSLSPDGGQGTVDTHYHSGDGIDCSYSTEAEFPRALDFSLSAESDAEISDIRLHYTVDDDSFAQVVSEVYIEFDPAVVVDVHWSWDMRKIGGLPMGSVIEYWWTVEDINGDKVVTAPAQIQFDDDRYSWRSLTEGKVTIHWYEGDDSFALEIMATSQQALARLANDTGAELAKPVQLYIYANTRDLI